jgi:hippurate hydrolase
VDTPTAGATDAVLRAPDGLLPDRERLYKDIHVHPELSMQETRTAGLAADKLRAAGHDVTTGIGQTGVVGLLRNGGGPVVMLRPCERRQLRSMGGYDSPPSSHLGNGDTST